MSSTGVARNEIGVAAHLVLPEGWVIDPSSVARLEASLAAADPSWAGVAAMGTALPPGSSYRVNAERRSLVDAVVRPAAPAAAVHGAVLLRDGIGASRVDGGVEVDGPLLVEPRATSFDPWQAVGPLEDASISGRPPFPHRPVVLFLGLEIDPDLADWARATVNALVRGDTEGRLAVPEPTGGLHLTRPCRPTAASVAALAPDVVVALDALAGAVVDDWLGADRSAIVVQLTEDTGDRVELVSWRVGRSSRRLRAQVGRGTTVPVLAGLVRRLCAGPQPLPPVDGDGASFSIRRRPARRTEAPTPSVLALRGTSSSAARARFAGWTRSSPAVGAFTFDPLSDEGLAAAATVDVVLLHDASSHPGLIDLVARRRADGLPTVIDLGPSDLVHHAGSRPGLTVAAAALVEAAGLATAPSGPVCATARQIGARSLRIPTFLPPARVAALEALFSEGAPEEIRLGWVTAGGVREPSAVDRAVASLLPSWLDRQPTLEVDVVGGVDHVVDLVRAHPRIHVEAGTPGTGLVRRWAVQVVTAPVRRTEADGDLRPVIEAQLLGVPTLLAVDHLAVAEGLVPPGSTVTDPADPSSWAVVDGLLTDPVDRARHSIQAQRLASGLYGPVAIASALNRLIGWVRFGGTR